MKIKLRKDGSIDHTKTKYDHFIVVGDSGTPMCWVDGGEQLYYCNAKQPVTVYPSIERAKVDIAKSKVFRKTLGKGTIIGQYDIIPLDI